MISFQLFFGKYFLFRFFWPVWIWIWICLKNSDSDIWIWIWICLKNSDSDVWIWIWICLKNSDSDTFMKEIHLHLNLNLSEKFRFRCLNLNLNVWIWMCLNLIFSPPKYEDNIFKKNLKRNRYEKNLKKSVPKNLQRGIPSEKIGKRNLYPKNVWAHFKQNIFDDDMYLTKNSLKRYPCQTNFNRNLYQKKRKTHVCTETLWREVCTKQFSK